MAALKIVLSQVVLCALLGVIAVNGKPPSPILDGVLADDNEFPFLVSVSSGGKHICGGTILDPWHILTAAHCVDDAVFPIRNMKVIAGTYYVDVGTGDEHLPENVTMHPGYSKTKDDPWRDDIAIVTLSSAIKLDSRHTTVKLPTSDTPVDANVTICGWGFTSWPNGQSSESLRKLSMVVVPNSGCVLPDMAFIHESHLCAYSRPGAGTCGGDSGGPLLNDEGTQVGIISFAYRCGYGYPDVFTRLFRYVDWISEVTQSTHYTAIRV